MPARELLAELKEIASCGSHLDNAFYVACGDCRANGRLLLAAIPIVVKECCKVVNTACGRPHPNSSSDGYYSCCGYDIKQAILQRWQIKD